MKLLILYTKNKNEIFNRKSAIGSYINCLGNIIYNNGISVYLNGQSLSKISSYNPGHSKKNTFIFNAIKSLTPKFIKRFVRDKNHLKSLSNFKVELLESETKYDAILEFYNIGSNIGYSIAKSQNIPLYITYDGPIIEEYTFFNSAKPFFIREILAREKQSLKFAQKIVVYSNPMKDFVISKSNNNSIFIHQNVDFTRFDIFTKHKSFYTEEINLCFIGSFLKWHQVDLLVNAFQVLIQNNIKAKLFLVGDGIERKAIENMISQLDEKVKSKIIFTGFLDGDELFELKKRMHIGVMPGSNWYGAPNKIFEYGAMRMAVLAPSTPTIDDLFTEDEVCFFEWKNQDSLNTNLLNFCKNKELLKNYSDVLHNKIVSKYSEKNTAIFYQNLINTKG